MKYRFLRVMCVVMSVCLVMSSAPLSSFGAPSLDSQRDQLEQQLADVERKLTELGSERKETKEYIDALNQKLEYLKKQYSITKQEADATISKVNQLESNIATNESEMEQIKQDIPRINDRVAELDESFKDIYADYCDRMRAMYISGGTQVSILSFILGSDSLSTFLTRFEMVRAVAKRDADLLSDVRQQSAQLNESKAELSKKYDKLTATQERLKADKEELKVEQASLSKKEDELAEQSRVIESQQKVANELLQKLDEKTKNYGEFRDITQEELDEIDRAIEEADKKYQQSLTTTTTKKQTTTKKPTTTTTTTPTSGSQSSDKTTTTTTTKPTTTTTNPSSSKYISLTYPCPAYTRITCGFGDYSGHSGCDFSTQKHENQRIVAAESGTVILVKLLEYSYGHYLVIRHDKTTPSGSVVYTLYAHNNDIIVSEGQHVSRGQQIAYSGTTGNSTGPHCHFEVRVGGSTQSCAVDPAMYLS